jgi:hypothetical protein
MSQDMHIEELMRSGVLSGDGFLGDDARPIAEIIRADQAELASLGLTPAALAGAAKALLALAIQAEGSPVAFGEGLQVVFIDSRGAIPCPIGPCGRFPKGELTITTAAGDPLLRLSPLSIHLIEAHGFFQGHGSPYRVEPQKAWEILRRAK